MKIIRYVRGRTKADKMRYITIRSHLNIFSFNDKKENTKWKKIMLIECYEIH